MKLNLLCCLLVVGFASCGDSRDREPRQSHALMPIGTWSVADPEAALQKLIPLARKLASENPAITGSEEETREVFMPTLKKFRVRFFKDGSVRALAPHDWMAGTWTLQDSGSSGNGEDESNTRKKVAISAKFLLTSKVMEVPFGFIDGSDLTWTELGVPIRLLLTEDE